MSQVWYFMVLVYVEAAFPPSLRYHHPISINKILEARVSCDLKSFNASVTLEHPFKGVLFAKDFSSECNSFGTLTNFLSINLPTSGCGVRLTSRQNTSGEVRMVYRVVLVAQQDRHLRQIADQEKLLECWPHQGSFTIQSTSLEEVFEKAHHNQRVGRMHIDNFSDVEDAFQASRAWMEIAAEDSPSSLQVGETAVLTFKVTLPVGVGWSVVECVAHDGLGDSSQTLLDEDGCPIDELLMPAPAKGPIYPILLMEHQEAVSAFPAFKFPDRDRLHLSCYLELCRGPCEEPDCSNRTHSLHTRLGRNLAKGSSGEVLDRLQVFNSIEVLAPAIDDLRSSDRLQMIDDPIVLEDGAFCVSPEKIAITFCVLGLIFLLAVIVAAFALIKGKANEGAFYTRSLFSSSSGGSAYGSKLLLQESPCMGQSASRPAPYGRIL